MGFLKFYYSFSLCFDEIEWNRWNKNRSTYIISSGAIIIIKKFNWMGAEISRVYLLTIRGSLLILCLNSSFESILYIFISVSYCFYFIFYCIIFSLSYIWFRDIKKYMINRPIAVRYYNSLMRYKVLTNNKFDFKSDSYKIFVHNYYSRIFFYQL